MFPRRELLGNWGHWKTYLKAISKQINTFKLFSQSGMLLLFSLWLLLAPVFFAGGASLLRVNRIDTDFLDPLEEMLLCILTGALLLNIVLYAISLFTGLNWIVLLVVCGTFCLSSLLARPLRSYALRQSRLPVSWIAALLIIGLGFAFYNSGYLVWYDSGLYHLNHIEWLHEYGAVKGLSLLSMRLGFDSSWYALPATLTNLPGNISLYTISGGFLLYFCITQILIIVFKSWRNRSCTIADMFVLISFPPLLMIIMATGMQRSPSPDFPALFLILETCWLIFIIKPATSRSWFLPLFLCTNGLTIKTGVLPLFAITTLFYLRHIWKDLRNNVSHTAISIMTILFPLLIHILHNIISSGCILYPMQYACLDTAWSTGPEAAALLSRLITEFAHWHGRKPELDGLLPYIIYWARIHFPLLALTFLNTVLLPFTMTLARNHLGSHRFWIISVSLAGSLFILLLGPTWRFGVSYFFILPGFVFAALAQIMIEKINIQSVLKKTEGMIGLFPWVMALFSVLINLLLVSAVERHLRHGINHAKVIDRKVSSRFLVPLPVHVHQIEIKSGNIETNELKLIPERSQDVEYFNPEKGDQCWNSHLMCTPDINLDIRLLAPSPGSFGGFQRSEASGK